MEGMIMTTQMLLSLSILIVVHEWGHFITARMFSIRVEKFYLFFDFLFPMSNVLNFSLFKYKRGDTQFGIGWFPLGGYVKIAGMVDESMDKEQLKSPPQPWEFRSKHPWQRLIVMLGGILVNVLVGILLFIGITYFMGDIYLPKDYINSHGGIYALELGEKLGLKTGDKIVKINGKDFNNFEDITKPDVLLSQGSYYTVVRNNQVVRVDVPVDFIENLSQKKTAGAFVTSRSPAVISQIADETTYTEIAITTKSDGKRDSTTTTKQKQSLAKKIGLQPGDQFLEIEGHRVQWYDEVTKIIGSRNLDTLHLKIKRGQEVLTFSEYFKGYDKIGISFSSTSLSKGDLSYIHYGLGQSILLGTGRAFGVIVVQLKAFRKIFAGELSFSKSLSGPIGMAQAYGGEWNWERLWRMTGLLSMVLAFMNLLPIPGLDGGYVMFLLYEMVSGRAPNEKIFETALKIGMAILLVLMVFVFYNDIMKILG